MSSTNDKLDITKSTLKVRAFGETRDVECLTFVWSDDVRGVYQTRIDTSAVFAARFRSGKKLWKVRGSVKQSQSEPDVYDLTTRYATVLNSNSAYICGWWAEKYAPVKSQHNSAE